MSKFLEFSSFIPNVQQNGEEKNLRVQREVVDFNLRNDDRFKYEESFLTLSRAFQFLLITSRTLQKKDRALGIFHVFSVQFS